MRCSCSFRSATDYRSPINGLSEINRFELFYKHCIPTGFSDRLLKVAESLVRWMFLKKNVRILAELKRFVEALPTEREGRTIGTRAP